MSFKRKMTENPAKKHGLYGQRFRTRFYMCRRYPHYDLHNGGTYTTYRNGMRSNLKIQSKSETRKMWNYQEKIGLHWLTKINKNGSKPDPENIDRLIRILSPKSLSQMRNVLEKLQRLQGYIPKPSAHTMPSMPWRWINQRHASNGTGMRGGKQNHSKNDHKCENCAIPISARHPILYATFKTRNRSNLITNMENG